MLATVPMIMASVLGIFWGWIVWIVIGGIAGALRTSWYRAIDLAASAMLLSAYLVVYLAVSCLACSVLMSTASYGRL